jgi:hypothetical protein
MKTIFKKRWYFIVPIILAGIVAFGYITMLLWNALLPEIFHLPEITFWQSLGLLFLFRLLFGGMGGHHARHSNHCRNNIREKWQNMTAEERENFMKNHNNAHDWCGRKE